MSIRFFVIYSSLVVLLIVISVFITGKLWGLPLDYDKGEHIQIIQIAIPPFLTYLSSAVAYATAGNVFPEPRGERGHILRAITVGGTSIFAVGFIMATVVFYTSGRGISTNGLSYEQYSNVVTILLAILGATTSAVTAFIFAARNDGRP